MTRVPDSDAAYTTRTLAITQGARLQELSLIFSRRTRELDATTRAGASLDAEPEDALNALDAAEASLQQLLDEAKLLLAGGQ